MVEHIISVDHLTKDYGMKRGVFDISLDIDEGEVFGYLGTNGSGKTTTIRHLMGFLKPDSGSVIVNGLSPWKNAPTVMKNVSYIPGEIAFPDLNTGTEFLKLQAKYLGINDFTYMNHLIDLLNIDTSANLKRMSKGMKQKTAIVAALMADKNILILDEPTTGLDPLMRETFIDLIQDEKKRGRTVFISSHIFDEIEEVCDRVAIIQDGKIIDMLNLHEFRKNSLREINITFENQQCAVDFQNKYHDCARDDNKVSLHSTSDNIENVFCAMRGISVIAIDEHHVNLEEYFMSLYERGGQQ